MRVIPVKRKRLIINMDKTGVFECLNIACQFLAGSFL